VTTASPHNHALLKGLGADAVFDYKDPDVSTKIRAWAKENGGVNIALNTGGTYCLFDVLHVVG
jgi:NADPH:quinone reductase-like Zn-dependent oxidoreductase